MVKFGAKLESVKNIEWGDVYINYNELKDSLHQYKSQRERYKQQNISNHDMEKLLNKQANEFSKLLDLEVEKVVLFFIKRQGLLAEQLSQLRQTKQEIVKKWTRVKAGDMEDVKSDGDQYDVILEGIDELFVRYNRIGYDIAELVTFLDLNVTGVRKILKKYDKQQDEYTDSVHLATNYFSKRINGEGFYQQYTLLAQLYHDEGIKALTASLRMCCIELQELKEKCIVQSLQTDDNQGHRNLKELKQAKSASFSLTRTFSEIRDTETEIEPVLWLIRKAQKKVYRERKRTVEDYIADYSGIFLESNILLEGTDVEDIDTSPVDKPDSMSIYLNLASTFLYMVNYYIITPTSKDYTRALGSSEALSGLVIGMTPIAACCSAFLYSIWTNKSFREPLIFSSFMLLIGNILYGLAYDLDILWLLFVGRILNGLGGARGVNRRYIADTIPFEYRTAASAAFVTAGALGMAVGPGCAALMRWAKCKIPITSSFTIHLNEMNAPGFFMSLLWLIYIIFLIRYFNDPDQAVIAQRMHRLAEHTRELSGSDSKTETGKKTKIIAKSYHGIKQASPGIKYGSIQTFDDNEENETKHSRKGCIHYLSTPVLLLLLVYFVDKFILELLLSSSALVVGDQFRWGTAQTSLLLVFLGLLVLPTNVFVGKLSSLYSDRRLLIYLMISCLIGNLVLLKIYGYTTWQYCIGAVILFVSLQSLEGIAMSILSKVISPELAVGTFNSGLLATEAGTFGRALGDASITFVGELWGESDLMNTLFFPCLMMMLATLFLSHYHRSKLR